MNIKKISASLIFSYGLASAVASLVLENIQLSFFDSSLPSLTPEIVAAKNFDVVELISFFILGVVIFLVNYKRKTSRFFDLYYLLFTLLVFLQTNSTEVLAGQVILMAFLGQAIYLLSPKLQKIKIKITLNKITFGILTGFVGLLVSHLVFDSYWWGFFALVTLPFLVTVYLQDKKFLDKIPSWVAKVVLLLLVLYNPLFYIGNLDTIEEGFWLAWVQRLFQSEVIYRDFAAYHPPLIPWGMYGFMKLFGSSIYSARLFFHLLQIVGLVIYFFFTEKLVKNRFAQLVVFVMALGLVTTGVRNNVEIRLGLGLLALMAWQVPVLAGALAALVTFLSVEIGVTSLGALGLFYLLTKTNRINNTVKLILGFIVGAAPFMVAIAAKGALIPFVSQITFYGKAFSDGYLNVPIERSVSTAFFRIHLFYEFLGSTAFLWVFVKGVLLGALIYISNKFIKKDLTKKDSLLVLVTIFALGIFRASLGRSDRFHLIFPLLIVLPIFFSLVERFKVKTQSIQIISLVFVFIIGAEMMFGSNSFLTHYFFRMQTYGRPVGEFKEFTHPRAKILVGGETGLERSGGLMKYIEENSSPNDSIFAFPWKPEIYFLMKRQNATSFDTPYAFFTQKYQQQMVRELEENKPNFVVYEPRKQFGNLEPKSLPIVDNYIWNNYDLSREFGRMQVLGRK